MEPMERRAYSTWNNIHIRCKTKSAATYKKYGAKGITPCERWTGLPNGFLAFIEDMGLPPSSKHSIDRIDNAKGYLKENCRWATAEQQVSNRKNTILVPYQGKKYTSRQIHRMFGIKPSLLWSRIKLGKTGDDLFVPVNAYVKTYDVGDGRKLTVSQIAKEIGGTVSGVHRRLGQGLTGADLIAPLGRVLD